MKEFVVTKILDYSSIDIFNVIIDVNEYTEFLPWCKKITIISKSDNKIIADMTVGFAGINKSYRSVITFNQPKNDNDEFKVNIESLNSNFITINSYWKVINIFKKKKIEYKINVEFKNSFLNKVFINTFIVAQKKIIDAFMKRIAYYNKQKLI